MGSHGSWKATAAALAVVAGAPLRRSPGSAAPESVLPPGQSGFVPPDGQPTNPHLTDQVRCSSFAFKPAGFDQPGSGRDAARRRRRSRATPTACRTCAPARPATRGSASATRSPRTASSSSSCSAARPRAGSPRCSARAAWTDDIVARRDYYTRAELRAQLASCPPPLRARFDAYADGVNAWIARVAADPSLRPREFALLGLTPAPWTPLDSASIGVQLARTVPSDDGRELDNWRALRALGASASPATCRCAGATRSPRCRPRGPLPVPAGPHAPPTSAAATRRRGSCAG